MDCDMCESDDVRYWVYERHLAEDGLGAVERDLALCSDCVEKAGPLALDQSYENYIFKIESAPDVFR